MDYKNITFNGNSKVSTSESFFLLISAKCSKAGKKNSFCEDNSHITIKKRGVVVKK
jgi:hypothetical protein